MKEWEHVMWFSFLQGTPPSKQIENKIIGEIILGRLKPGEKIPSVRQLARFYCKDKKTVEAVYKRLEAKNWVYRRERFGTYVSLTPPLPDSGTHYIQLSEILLTGYSASLDEFLAEDLPDDSTYLPGSVYFDDPECMLDGNTAVKLLTLCKRFSSWQYRRKLNNAFSILFQTVSQVLCRNPKLYHTPDELCLMTGAKNVISMVAWTLIREGDVVVMYMPGNMVWYNTFRNLKAEVILVDGDYDQFAVQLAGIVKSRKIKAVYIETGCHYPTTRTFSYEQKLQILSLASSFRFRILEVNYDREFWYDNRAFEPLISLNRTSVIYLSSVSLLLPQLYAVKYVLGPPDFIKALTEVWRNMKYKDDATCLARAQLIESGIVALQVKKLIRACYRDRELAGRLIAHYLGDYVNFEKPAGGFAYWLELKDPALIIPFLDALRKERIFIPDTRLYYPSRKQPKGFRLGFAGIEERTAVPAFEKMAKILGR